MEWSFNHYPTANNSVSIVGRFIVSKSYSKDGKKQQAKLMTAKNGATYVEFSVLVPEGSPGSGHYNIVKCIAWNAVAKYLVNNIYRNMLVSVGGKITTQQVQLDAKTCPHCKKDLKSRYRDRYCISVFNISYFAVNSDLTVKDDPIPPAGAVKKAVWEIKE